MNIDNNNNDDIIMTTTRTMMTQQQPYSPNHRNCTPRMVLVKEKLSEMDAEKQQQQQQH